MRVTIVSSSEAQHQAKINLCIRFPFSLLFSVTTMFLSQIGIPFEHSNGNDHQSRSESRFSFVFFPIFRFPIFYCDFLMRLLRSNFPRPVVYISRCDSMCILRYQQPAQHPSERVSLCLPDTSASIVLSSVHSMPNTPIYTSNMSPRHLRGSPLLQNCSSIVFVDVRVHDRIRS